VPPSDEAFVTLCDALDDFHRAILPVGAQS